MEPVIKLLRLFMILGAAFIISFSLMKHREKVLELELAREAMKCKMNDPTAFANETKKVWRK